MRPDDPELAKSIPQLLRDLADETSTLVRQELALARAELLEKARPVERSAGLFSASALLGLGAFGAVTAALIALVALVVPVWAAALIVAVVYGIAAFVAARQGQQTFKSAAPLVPEQTAETVKEDVAWAKTRAKSGRT